MVNILPAKQHLAGSVTVNHVVVSWLQTLILVVPNTLSHVLVTEDACETIFYINYFLLHIFMAFNFPLGYFRKKKLNLKLVKLGIISSTIKFIY